MKYKYIYDPIAFIEYKDAISWYALRNLKVAENFVSEVTQKIGLICVHPLRYRNSYKDFREIVLKKYPFNLVYFVDEKNKTIIITSVYHQKRNPNKKFKK